MLIEEQVWSFRWKFVKDKVCVRITEAGMKPLLMVLYSASHHGSLDHPKGVMKQF